MRARPLPAEKRISRLAVHGFKRKGKVEGENGWLNELDATHTTELNSTQPDN